jgi:mannosyl-glycoprotein endo-beta-N-acetylglucosaminidase
VSAPIPADVIAAAQAAQKKWGVPASVTLAQWILESGRGEHMPAGSSNPWGIKAVGGQPFVEARTIEYIDGVEHVEIQRFRKFGSLAEAFDAHAALLGTSRYYAKARAALPDALAFAHALTGVYATDLHYGDKLEALIVPRDKAGQPIPGADLRQYDAPPKPVITQAKWPPARAAAPAPSPGLWAQLLAFFGLGGVP